MSIQSFWHKLTQSALCCLSLSKIMPGIIKFLVRYCDRNELYSKQGSWHLKLSERVTVILYFVINYFCELFRWKNNVLFFHMYYGYKYFTIAKFVSSYYVWIYTNGIMITFFKTYCIFMLRFLCKLCLYLE